MIIALSISPYTVRRGMVNLLSSLLLLIYFGMTSQLGKINLIMEASSLTLDLTGTFLVLIGVWSLLVLKNVYDIYDFRKNARQYKQNVTRS
ncbi:MAG: hypothetical protein ACW986_12725 [Promethearchaeota archaeon]